MSILDALIAHAGPWSGTNMLQDPEHMAPETTPSTLAVVPVLGGRFVRLDYTWSYRGQPQEGSLLIGFQEKAELVTCHWIDTFHVGSKVMVLQGLAPSGPTVSLLGSYEAPPGPDWGWKIEITADGGEPLKIVMYNLWPEGGREDLAVEAVYMR